MQETLTAYFFQQVISWKGVTLPGSGVHLPAGTSIGFPQLAVHRDQGYYCDALNYHAFRHTADEYLIKDRYIRGDVPEDICKRNALTTTSHGYLVFGFGRHVCPGRYVFAYLAKLILAEIILNYDIEPIGSLPEIKRELIFHLLFEVLRDLRLYFLIDYKC